MGLSVRHIRHDAEHSNRPPPDCRRGRGRLRRRQHLAHSTIQHGQHAVDHDHYDNDRGRADLANTSTRAGARPGANHTDWHLGLGSAGRQLHDADAERLVNIGNADTDKHGAERRPRDGQRHRGWHTVG